MLLCLVFLILVKIPILAVRLTIKETDEGDTILNCGGLRGPGDG